MRIGVVGSRDISDYDYVRLVLSTIVQPDDIIISGGAKGVDRLAERYANENDIECVVYKPDWDKYGKQAGLIRNGTIVEDSDYIVAIWDGESKGTMDTIHKAEVANKQVMKFVIVKDYVVD